MEEAEEHGGEPWWMKTKIQGGIYDVKDGMKVGWEGREDEGYIHSWERFTKGRE